VVKNAVAFIRSHADRLELNAADGRTTLVMSKRLGRMELAAL